MSALTSLVRDGLRWAVETRREAGHRPLLGSLVLTDRCNLHCRHCTVAHLGYPRVTLEDARGMLQALFDRGCRLAVITGGEPFLWRDGVHGLEDVVERARDVGFAWVAVCTNGTFPLRSRADVLVVSVDGLPHQVERLRGDAWSRLRRSLETAEHPHVVGEMTVTSENVDDLERAAEHVVAMKPLAGVLFRLFTPYVGADDSLLLDEVQRSRAIDTLLATKRRHPRRVLNSFTALRAWRDGGWARPVWATLIACRGELTGCCCRGGIADARTCRHCGEPTAVEAWALQRLSPEALAGGLRML